MSESHTPEPAAELLTEQQQQTTASRMQFDLKLLNGGGIYFDFYAGLQTLEGGAAHDTLGRLHATADQKIKLHEGVVVKPLVEEFLEASPEGEQITELRTGLFGLKTAIEQRFMWSHMRPLAYVDERGRAKVHVNQNFETSLTEQYAAFVKDNHLSVDVEALDVAHTSATSPIKSRIWGDPKAIEKKQDRRKEIDANVLVSETVRDQLEQNREQLVALGDHLAKYSDYRLGKTVKVADDGNSTWTIDRISADGRLIAANDEGVEQPLSIAELDAANNTPRTRELPEVAA